MKPVLDVSDIIDSSIIKQRAKLLLLHQKLYEPKIKLFLYNIFEGKGALIEPAMLNVFLSILPTEQ